MAAEHWVTLTFADGLGPVLTRRLVEAAGSAEAACVASSALLRQVEGVGEAIATKVAASLRGPARVEAARAIERAVACGAAILCPDDEAYPALLQEIPDPPAALYVRGTLEPRDLHAVAIVGSRRCSLYGREQAERFAALLAGAGLTVVSGGARGVDSAAHRGAMQPLNGRTLAVLGCGIDIAYPPENDALFRQISADGRGAVLSEFPPGTPPSAENFPRRNRVISGLSRGVLVIEADLRSGALITARQAADDHGRTVMALPGRVDNPTSAGPHQLIRDGATLVTGLDDILEALGPLPHAVTQPSLFEPASVAAEAASPAPVMNDEARAILNVLAANELAADQIIEATGLPAPAVLRQLTLLSLKGAVRRVDAVRYAAGKGQA